MMRDKSAWKCQHTFEAGKQRKLAAETSNMIPCVTERDIKEWQSDSGQRTIEMVRNWRYQLFWKARCMWDGKRSLKVCKILSWTRIPSSSLCSQNIGSFPHPQRQSLLLERTSYCISGLWDMRTAEEMDEPFNWIWSDSVKFCILNSKSPNSLPLLAPKKSHMHPRSYPPSLQPAWGIRL